MSSNQLIESLIQVALTVFILGAAYRWFSRVAWGWIELPSTKFWSLVATTQQPLVILSTRGFFRRSPRYLFPHHGVFFYTRTRPDEIPPGVTLVSTDDAPV